MVAETICPMAVMMAATITPPTPQMVCFRVDQSEGVLNVALVLKRCNAFPNAAPDVKSSGGTTRETMAIITACDIVQYPSTIHLGKMGMPDAGCTRAMTIIVGEFASLKGDANQWLEGPEYEALRHRLEIAHAATEAAVVEARRRVRMDERRL
jgi:hypothetical protein